MRKIAVFVTLLSLGLGLRSTARAGMVPVTTPTPNNWNASSGSSRGDDYASAWGNMGGESMGIPEYVSSYIDWQYSDDSDGLFFSINFSTAGDIEKPTEAVNLNTGGSVNVNSVTIQESDNKKGDQWFSFQFDRELSIGWNGGYSSWLRDDGSSSGSFNGSAWVSPDGDLTATSEFNLNHWDGPIEDEPAWFNDYDARVQIYGYIPSSSYTMSIVPEPATMTLFAIGGATTLWRRRKDRDRNLIA